MINNPVGAAIAYKQMVHNVMSVLFGLKPTNYSVEITTEQQRQNLHLLTRLALLGHHGRSLARQRLLVVDHFIFML